MKLLVCLFLIVVLLEEYKCAPYRRTRSRYRHHHGLQYGSSRHRSPYRSPGTYYGRNGHGYQPHHYTYHPWRNSHHSTWHSPRYNYRHHFGHGYRHSSRPLSWYNTWYGSSYSVPNVSPTDYTENKSWTVETPTYDLVEKATVRPENKSTEERVDKSTEKPLEMPLTMPADNLAGELVENSTVKPIPTTTVTATNLAEIEIPQDITLEKVTEKPVETSSVKPTPTLTMTEINRVIITDNKLQDVTLGKVTEDPVENSTAKPTKAVTATYAVKIPEEAQGWTDKKLLEPKKYTSGNFLQKSTPDPVKSSFEILSDYSTINPFNDLPVENLPELSTGFPFQ